MILTRDATDGLGNHSEFKHFLLRHLRRFDEKIGLLQCFGDAAARDVEVFRLDFDADELAAEFDGGNACGAGAHEGVEDHFPRQ